jgi:hypothetical protein
MSYCKVLDGKMYLLESPCHYNVSIKGILIVLEKEVVGCELSGGGGEG